MGRKPGRRFAIGLALASVIASVIATSAWPQDTEEPSPAEAPSEEAPPEPSGPLAVGAKLPDSLRLLPTKSADRGAEPPKTVTIASLAGDPPQPLVLLFWSAKCPVCKRYGKTASALVSDFAKRARFVFAFPNANETDDEIRTSMTQAELAVAAFTDPDQNASARLDVAVTPTALVFDANGVLRYRGPIDDDRRAKDREARKLLRDALEAVTAKRDVTTPEPRAFGCAVRRER